jgi:hypothetical protein
MAKGRHCEIARLFKIRDKIEISIDYTNTKLEEKFDRLYSIVKTAFKMGREW